MNFYDRPLDHIAPTPYSRALNRPTRGIVLHHTATPFDPMPRAGGSWHWLINRDSSITRDVAEEDIAHHAGATDRWRPSWVVPGPGNTSDINWCSIGIEITYAPQDGQSPTEAQEEALRVLLTDIYERHGPLPVVGHGEIDRSKWLTEPHALNWSAAGMGEPTEAGRWLVLTDTHEEDEMATLTDLQREMLSLMEDPLYLNPGAVRQLVSDKSALEEEVRRLMDLVAQGDTLGAEDAEKVARYDRIRGIVLTP